METIKFRWLNLDQQLIEIKTGNQIAVRKYDDALAYYFENEFMGELQALEELSIQISDPQTMKQTVAETSPDGEYMEICDYDPESQQVYYLDNDYQTMDTFAFFGHILHDLDKTQELEKLIALRKLGVIPCEFDQLLTQFVKFTEYKTGRTQLFVDQLYKQLPVEQAIKQAKKEVFTKHEGTDLSLSLALRGLLEDYEVDSTLILLNEPGKEPRYGCGYLDPETEEYRVIDIKSFFKTVRKEDIISLSLTELSVAGNEYAFGSTQVAVVDEQSADCIEYLSTQPLTTILEIIEETRLEPRHTLRHINENLSTVLFQKKYCPTLWENYQQGQDFFSRICFAKDQLANGKYDELSVALLLAEQASKNNLDHWLVEYIANGKSCWGNLVVEWGNCYICTKGEAAHLYQERPNQPLAEFVADVQNPDTFCKNHPEAVVINPYFLEKKDNIKIRLADFSNTLVYQTRMEESNLEDYLLGIPKRIRKIKK